MSIASDMSAGDPTRFAAMVSGALRGIGWPQVRGAMLFGLAVTVFSSLVFAPAIQTLAAPLPMLLLVGAIGDQIRALCLMVAIVVADKAVDEGARRRSAYVAAALAGCALGVALSEPFDAAWRAWFFPEGWGGKRPWLYGTALYIYSPIFHLTNWLLIGGSAVFLYADRRAAQQTEARLRAAELDRTRRSRVALESRLQAMQARIEPQFLFNTLAQVERHYALDPTRGARMLDELIAYLRAAMPLMRDTSSTLAQEIALARAYLDIVRLGLHERLEVDIEVPAGADEIRMPPMMLLPLIDHAIVRGLEPATGTGAIRIRSEVSGGRLRLTIVDSGVGFAPEAGGDGIAVIRERLEALYGGDARLDLHRAEERATRAVLDLPLETRAPFDEGPAPASAAGEGPDPARRGRASL